MTSPLPPVQTCRVCGAPVPADAILGHCPKCLIQHGLLAANGSPGASPPAGLELQRRFADYVLGSQIGRGGMGVVYEARHVRLHRPVALKVILDSQVASPVARRRFTVEAEAAAKLDHPNIVPIYEVGEHEGQPFISMRLVAGESLRTKIVRGEYQWKSPDGGPAKANPRDRQEAIARLMATLARAVHHAHQRGVLHRDLKPGNILIDARGQPYLTDFGLAKITEPEPGDAAARPLTLSGAVLGTPGYMSPEQVTGGPMTTATDIYSLGAILYELLTSHPPFKAHTPLETMQQVLEQEPRRPRADNPLIHSDLETISLKCLEKNPAARYASAEALADDLDRWLRCESIKARPAGWVLRTGRWIKRNPIGTALIGSLCVGLGVALFLLDLAHQRQHEVDKRRDLVIRQQRNAIEADWYNTNKPSITVLSEILSVLGNYRGLEERLGAPLRLSFAISITESPVEQAINYVPFVKRLERDMSERLDRSVVIDLVLLREFSSEHEYISLGKVDLLRVGAWPYVLAKSANPGVQPVIQEDEGKKAVIFVRRELYEQGLTNLGQLAGHSFACGGDNSTITFMAKLLLVRAGIRGTNLTAVKAFRSFDPDTQEIIRKVQAQTGQTTGLPIRRAHREALRAVLKGRYDVGVARRQYFDQEAHKGLVELHAFEVPPDVYVARADLDAQVIKAFRETLLALRDQELLTNLPMQPVRQFQPASDADYLELRRASTNELRQFESGLPSSSE